MLNSAKDERELQRDLKARLLTMGGEQEERLARHRAQELNLPYISLMVFHIDPDVLEQVPKSEAQEAQAVLFYKQGRDVRLGAVNPNLPALKELLEDLKQKFRGEPHVYVISHRSFKKAMARYRRETEKQVVPRDELRVDAEKIATIEDAIANLKELGAHITRLSPTELLTTIATGAVKVGASDIHVEPAEDGARLRYRIDGVLQDIVTFARSGWRLLLSRTKVMAQLKLNVKDVPQDGSFTLTIGDHAYDVRVSTLPGGEGENIVMRLLDREAEIKSIADLGMKKRDEEVVRRELRKSNGMILVTGPTGSGKTTSLAAFVNEVNEPSLKIITLENPIEYHIEGVEQTQIDESAGYTFAKGLRAILRQDPDVVMVGEVRDEETAETAIHAALTGHLVFTTLHTNNAPDSIVRLVDMGVQANVMAPALNVVIAQRLVRIVCQECAESYAPTAQEKDHIIDVMRGVSKTVFEAKRLNDPKLVFLKAKGCSKCNGMGYRGRVGIFEVMPVMGKVEELILQGASSNQLREAAQAADMTTILQDGYLKVLDGITTVEEVGRVTEE